MVPKGLHRVHQILHHPEEENHFPKGRCQNCQFGEKLSMLNQRTLTIGGRITVQLVSSLTRLELTNEGNIIIFVFSEAV